MVQPRDISQQFRRFFSPFFWFLSLGSNALDYTLDYTSLIRWITVNSNRFRILFHLRKSFFWAGQFWLCERRVRITSMPSEVVVISVAFGPGEVGLRGVFGPKPNIRRKKPSTKLNKNITAVLNSKRRRMNRAMVLCFFLRIYAGTVFEHPL